MYKELYNWLNELINVEPNNFAEFFYRDIGEYLNISNESDFHHTINKTTQQKLISLRNCKSKNEVKIWLDESTSYIVKHLDVENIIDNYLS
jgi:hypothetical protein